jgi:ElaB/YqjD/DUF883 family membrane-anchored ribosome-binding protein
MSNPSENDFVEDEPLAAAANAAQNEEYQQRGLRRAARKASVVAGETWEQTKEKAGMARDRTEYFMRENPIPTIVGALTIGLAIGWALRYATEDEEKELEIESPLGNFNWSYLSLPFLWPFLKTVKEKYEDSAETVKEGVDRIKDIDVRRYTKPIRKRWKAWRD